jgi:hypothetical protein
LVRPVPGKRRHRLYIDESGDHAFSNANNDHQRYLGLLGLWFDTDKPFIIDKPFTNFAPYRDFAQALSDLKRNIFDWHPDELPICLHRKDLINCKGAFRKLRDPKLNKRFEHDLLEVVGKADFIMTCVVIDKKSHQPKTYRKNFDPYHYCLAALLERYAGWLNHHGALGDVMAESRGKREDQELCTAFKLTYQNGTNIHDAQYFQRALTSGEIKLRKKEHAIPGLELADLLAYPFKREMVTELRGEDRPQDFSSALLDVARLKMNRHIYKKEIAGYGTVWLS